MEKKLKTETENLDR